MVFSEVIGQDNNWINNQIEKSLQESTHAELTDLKKLVLDSSKNVKLEKTSGTTIDLKAEHIVSVLNQNKNKSRNEIYGTGMGAGVTFAVQYVLDKMGYAPGTIDGYMGNQTKAAVKKFQEDWNRKNPLLKITEDGLAGGKTLEKMSFAMQHIYLWKATSPQQSQTPETPEVQTSEAETENSEIMTEDFDPFDPVNAAIINEGAEKIKGNNSNVVNAKAYAYDKEHKQILYYDGASTGNSGRGSYMYSPETKKAHQLLAVNTAIDFSPLLTQVGLLKDDRDTGFSLLRKLNKDTINKLNTPSTYSEGWTGLVGERKTAFLNRLRNKPDGKKFVTWINKTTMPNPTLNSRYIQEKLMQMSKNYSRWDEVKLDQTQIDNEGIKEDEYNR